VLLYPDPATTEVNVWLKDPSAPVLSVTAMNGSRVEAPIRQQANGFLLDVSQLAPGMYAVRTTIGSARFVKH
jgi:hypothetical protein